MPRDRLPRIMKRYSPTGRRDRGRTPKRLLDTWDRNGSTSGLTPWQTYDDDDDDDKKPTLCTKFLFYNKFISCIYMFRAHELIIRRSKLHYTASGINTRKGGRLVHQTATFTCVDTRGCVMQFWPPDDERMCSKNVQAWNKLNVKQNFCASSWLITEINIHDFITDFNCGWIRAL